VKATPFIRLGRQSGVTTRERRKKAREFLLGFADFFRVAEQVKAWRILAEAKRNLRRDRLIVGRVAGTGKFSSPFSGATRLSGVDLMWRRLLQSCHFFGEQASAYHRSEENTRIAGGEDVRAFRLVK
jgi:hypothetical protein